MTSLQCARAFAALLVVYFHAVIQLTKIFPEGTIHFVLFGKCGVDVFFVISGLIMWLSTMQKDQSSIEFYKRRLARIAPLYWVVTLVAAATAFCVPALLNSTRFELDHVIASLLFIPWPNPASRNGYDVMTPVIVPGWTLNFEMMFYALFGLGLFGRHQTRLVRLAMTFAAFILLVSLARTKSPILDFYDPHLFGEFLLGIAIGVLIEKGWKSPPFALAILAGAALLLLALDTVSSDWSRFYVAGIPAAIGVYCLTTLDREGRWPELPYVILLGNASYSIYLVHIFVLTALRIIWPSPALEPVFLLGPGAFVFAALVMSCLIGLLTYQFVERPLCRAAARLLGLQRHAGTAEGRSPERFLRRRRAA